MTHQCPVCKGQFEYHLDAERSDPPCFPFCSERCKWVDLGAWLDTDYRITARPDYPDPVVDDIPDRVVF